MVKKAQSVVPVVDLFAGPGGLGEGFSTYFNGKHSCYRICLSIEKDERAHHTLLLRSFYRQFQQGTLPKAYFDYLRGDIAKDELFKKFPSEFANAKQEAVRLTLAPHSRNKVRDLIKHRLRGVKTWVLIGGPPCQAYSVVGRSRMLGNGAGDRGAEERTTKYELDKRHILYREYLRIIADNWPPIFVMENVPGILSAKLKGELVFPNILADLEDPGKALKRAKSSRQRYRVYSLVKRPDATGSHVPKDFVIRSEQFGIPQTRHRVLLLGLRHDLGEFRSTLLPRPSAMTPTVAQVIADLPAVRSGLSRQRDTIGDWRSAIDEALTSSWFKDIEDTKLKCVIKQAVREAHGQQFPQERGKNFIASRKSPKYMSKWYQNPQLAGVCNHVSRTHINADLHRYLFVSCYALCNGRAPHLSEFPEKLLPDHRNVEQALNSDHFGDRFRVQVWNKPATTITSHLSKDGHYFIHPDPAMCRSFTVREAARVQTFPDDYFFEGPRTAQYIQVGNAVPPLLAYNIAGVVWAILKDKGLV